jgi:hypothetical protein
MKFKISKKSGGDNEEKEMHKEEQMKLQHYMKRPVCKEDYVSCKEHVKLWNR